MNGLCSLKICSDEKEIWYWALADTEKWVLFDCGRPGDLTRLEQEVKNNGLVWSNLQSVIITHHDYDHIGSLADVKTHYPGVAILAAKEEIPYITGEKKPLHLERLEKLYETTRAEEILREIAMIRSIKNIPVEKILRDGEVLPFGGGLRVIATPGHTPGHISIFLEEFHALVSGDILRVENGKLFGPRDVYTMDMTEAKKSLAKLLSYDISIVLTNHGGVYERDVQGALRNILRNFV